MTIELIQEARSNGARLSKSCEIMALDVRTYQRWRKQPNGGEDRRAGPRHSPKNRLTERERETILDTLNSSEYRNLSPKQVVPALADKGTYLASESTMYRILQEGELTAHRAASKPPAVNKPRELIATGPDQVFSWDITYLRGPVAGQFFYLYMVIDVWSRKIVGWAVHESESSDHAAVLFTAICRNLGLSEGQATLHADRGSPMKGATLRATLERLGILTSFSRPRVCDDNPFSEALFRTLKYRPEYPTKPFESLEAARTWVASFVRWYNTEHKHSAIGFVTPEERHRGADRAILAQRRRVYALARQRHPERWTRHTRRWESPELVYLNPKDPLNTVTGRSKKPCETAAA
jgi:transposase InsO family protein